MSGVVWVRTAPTPDGKSYMATIEADDDHARSLSPTEAITYAREVLAAAAHAEFDASVFAQMTAVEGIGRENASMLVLDLRKDRRPLDPAAIAPLGLEPGVNPQGKPFLTVSIGGKRVGQWTPADARGHALHVLEVSTGADLDAAYYRVLRGVVGLDENRARNIVGELVDHRPPR